MNHYKIYILTLLTLAMGLSSCDDRQGQTVESAYLYPLLPVPEYKFSRNGGSSVDTRESELLSSSVELMYKNYMSPARVNFSAIYDLLMGYYTRGQHSGYAPYDHVCTSALSSARRAQTLQELQALIDESARLSGLPISGRAHPRNTAATPGSGGYIGVSVGSDGVHYADARGLVVSEVFLMRMMGAIYLDKLFGTLTDDAVLQSAELRQAHERLSLLQGHNYTALEHTWDSAYGYYKLWQPLIKGEGMSLLRGAEGRIYHAFVQARTDLGRTEMGYLTYDYESMMRQRDTIRTELSRAIAARAIYYLIGPNVLANLGEEPRYAFSSISRGIGLLYCLSYTRQPNGEPYFSVEQIEAWASALLQGDGLWDSERLLSGAEVEGSLRYVVKQLAQPWGLDVNNL